jgi:Phage tail tube protein
MQPGELSFVGIAKETVEGTFVPSTAFIGCSKIQPLNPVDYMDVMAMRGSMVDSYGVVQGFKWGGIELGGPVFADTIGWILAGILGDLTNAGTAAPFSSAMSLKNSGNGQPVTHSVNDFYVAANRAIAGLKWTDLEIKWTAEGLLEFDAKGTGLSSATQTKPSASITAVLPTPAWIGVLTIGGSGVVKTSDGSIKFTRQNKVLKLINGTQVPTTVFLGALEVTGKYKAVMDDETELTRYLTNTQPVFQADFQQGVGAALTEVKIVCSQAAYNKDPKITQQVGGPVEIDAEFTAMPNATDAGASGGVSPCKVTIQSAVQGTTFQ